MLETIAVIVIVFCLLDLVSPYSMRWLVNVFLVLAFVVILIRLVRGEALYWP